MSVLNREQSVLPLEKGANCRSTLENCLRTEKTTRIIVSTSVLYFKLHRDFP
ncbi:MAG: hypothetical protein NTY38_10885 [Acidobacteria bacterium]|nr:hypothetical protein [Acidobacteriota bacterium]